MNQLAKKFLDAQDKVGFDTIMWELQNWRKESHWMWFVFPQLIREDSSVTSKHFGLADIKEAKELWKDPVFRSRYKICVGLLLDAAEFVTAEHIFGEVDSMKLRSSLTLFLHASKLRRDINSLIELFFVEQCPWTLPKILTC